VKKFSKATSAAAQHPRVAARLVLAFVASVLVVLLALMGMSSGPNGATVLAQATESPTGSPSGPAGPQIQLLNPHPSYNPKLSQTDPEDPPKISDKYDGHDRAYHIVAWTKQAPAGGTVEAYWQPSGGTERTIGLLSQVPGAGDTWEIFWDIPSDYSEGSGEVIVRLFKPASGGFEKIAEHKVTAQLQHEGSYADGDDEPAEETVELTWPAQNGEIGFHKPKGGFWRAVVDGVASGSEPACTPVGGCAATGGTLRVYVFFSTAAPGEDPKYQQCGFISTSARPVKQDGSIEWRQNCTLPGKTLPSEVTAMVALASETDTPARSGILTQESADAHRVRPYVQDVRRMNVALAGVPAGSSAAYPTGQRRTADSDCLEFDVTVTDHNDRPVQGANVDIHLQGPSDEVGFGDEGSSSNGSSAEKAPDKDPHTKEDVWDCDSPGNRYSDQQGDHDVPGGSDNKHIESTLGTGLDGPSGIAAGQFRFHIYSPDPGRSTLTAWVDDAPLPTEDAAREADDDVKDSAEPSGSITAQWFSAPMTATISPRADSAVIGECNRYVLRARAGKAAVNNINVDIHASGPSNELDFCDPGDATARRAPDKPEGDTAHAPEDEGEATHAGAKPEDPHIQHTEGETDSNGNFVFGITSPSIGATKIEAWVDGEAGQDDDVKNTGEVTSTASKNWAGGPQDAEVRFVNPSGYGGAGNNISSKRDADELYHLVARVDLPNVVEGVEFFLMNGETLVRDLGDGTRLGSTDTWELFTVLPDGKYTLRAQIINTNKREDRAVVVNNTLETVELSQPGNGAGAPFSEGETSVAGVASADAEGVQFYYTKTDARETRNAAQWISCGETELPTADAPQSFEGKCALKGTDAALDVTGIAALAWICDSLTGCDLGRTYQTGDAHRVYGFEANPSVTIEPTQTSAAAGKCQRFELTVNDAVGNPIPDANVDVHLTGPEDAASFCELSDGSPRRAPTTGGHAASADDGEAAVHQNQGADTLHTEGEADENGKFIFGVTSGKAGTSQIVGWADQNDNDEIDSDEKSQSGAVNWRSSGDGNGGDNGCTISGDGGNNVLRGTPGRDIICGFGGADRLIGRGDNDLLRGGRGRDILRGGRGADVMRGGGGPDRLRGGAGRDRLYGNAGNDFLNGQAGRDFCRGGRGRDITRSC
jgi:Ca2+-binding RTX toxin-like protein